MCLQLAARPACKGEHCRDYCEPRLYHYCLYLQFIPLLWPAYTRLLLNTTLHNSTNRRSVSPGSSDFLHNIYLICCVGWSWDDEKPGEKWGKCNFRQEWKGLRQWGKLPSWFLISQLCQQKILLLKMPLFCLNEGLQISCLLSCVFTIIVKYPAG